jgi:hypothetical protein
MTEIINLRLARKRRRRAEEAQRAAENRTAHGQPMQARKLRGLQEEIEAKRHEGHRRTPPSD